MKILSLFDGMSCGQIALDRLGIKVDKYYASEIDKYAMQVTQANFPETIQIGDVCAVRGEDYQDVDLMLAGSPCQGFSFAGKQLAFDDPRSALFFEFIRLLKEIKPKYFLLENVKMKKEYLQIISEQVSACYPEIPFGIEPIFINSSLVSAQSRPRYYWTNIPGIEQPEERGIVLKDILEDRNIQGLSEKAIAYMNRSSPKWSNGKTRKDIYIKREDQKGDCLTANMHKGVPYGVIETTRPNSLVDVRAMTEVRTPEANQIRYEHKRKTGKDWSPRHMRHLVERPDEKMNTLTSALTKQHILQITKDKDQEVYWRKLTPLECERLQTVPDNYTEGVSNTQRYKMLGNGWTVEVICHILKNMDF